MDFKRAKIAALILAIGNLFHFIAIIHFYLRINFIVEEMTFFNGFFYLLLLDWLANILFLILILPMINTNREEIVVLSAVFYLITLFSRLIATGAIIEFYRGDFSIYIPSFLEGIMNTLLTQLNLIALPSIFYSIILFLLSKNKAFETKESSLKTIAAVDLIISSLFVLPSNVNGSLFLLSSTLFIVKATIFPIIIFIVMILWYFDLRKLETDEKQKTVLQANSLVDDELFQKQEDLQARLFYSEQITEIADVLLERITVSEKLEKIAEILEIVNVTGVIIYESHPLDIYTIKNYGTNADDYNYTLLEQLGFILKDSVKNWERYIISHQDDIPDQLLGTEIVSKIHGMGLGSFALFPLNNNDKIVVFTNMSQYMWDDDEIQFLNKTAKLLQNIE